MDPDFALTLGLVLAVLAVPAIYSSLMDRRAPRASILVLLIAGGLTVFALDSKPGGYTMEQAGDAVIRTFQKVVL